MDNYMSTKIICHRGLLNGPDKNLENLPEQIIKSCSLGFDCEIDLWVIKDNLYLGHDLPEYIIEENFLYNDSLWLHAKNIEALHWLTKTKLKYFWHQNDDYTITSNGFIWVYPGKHLIDNSIAVMPEKTNYSKKELEYCYAICTDFPYTFK